MFSAALQIGGMNNFLTPMTARRRMSDRAATFEPEPKTRTMRQTIGRAIKAARKTGGLTQEGLASEIGKSRATVAAWEGGDFLPDVETLAALEALLNTPAGALRAPSLKTARVIGYVQAGDHGAEAIHHPEPIDLGGVTLPTSAINGDAWLQVRGNSMLPDYRAGDLICYNADGVFDPVNCLRRRCVVQISDGRVLIKTLQPGSTPGRYDLASSNADLMTDELVAWAAPVKAVVFS
jgi:transcriptional regulator with XRE-family HTH domain